MAKPLPGLEGGYRITQQRAPMKTTSNVCFAGWIVAMLLVIGSLGLAQIATTGQVVGSVQDSSGAAVPGVTLKLENAATKAVQTTTAGSDGGFVFPIGSQPLDRLSAACKTHREPRFQV